MNRLYIQRKVYRSQDPTTRQPTRSHVNRCSHELTNRQKRENKKANTRKQTVYKATCLVRRKHPLSTSCGLREGNGWGHKGRECLTARNNTYPPFPHSTTFPLDTNCCPLFFSLNIPGFDVGLNEKKMVIVFMLTLICVILSVCVCVWSFVCVFFLFEYSSVFICAFVSVCGRALDCVCVYISLSIF